MKAILMVVALFSSLSVHADIPRPNPNPGKSVDSEAVSVLVYGAPAAKLTALKTGANKIEVKKSTLRMGVDKFIFTSRQCSYGIAGEMCLENKQLTITRKTEMGPDRKVVSYESSEVSKLR